MDEEEDLERLKYGRDSGKDSAPSDGTASPSSAGDIGRGGKSEMNSSSTLMDRGGGRSTSASKSCKILVKET